MIRAKHAPKLNNDRIYAFIIKIFEAKIRASFEDIDARRTQESVKSSSAKICLKTSKCFNEIALKLNFTPLDDNHCQVQTLS